ncbi:MAG: rhodanese-like domain-containing protein, partial [Pseudomonadota bacterium]
MDSALLMTPAELAARLERPATKVLDVRVGESFAMGHVPSAAHFSVYGVNTYDTDEAPLASFVRMWAFQLSLRGLEQHHDIIVYDDHTGMSAARAFWFLEYLGHRRVWVLDGGWSRWVAEGYPQSREAIPPAPASYRFTRQRERVADWQDVLRAIDDPASVVIDARRRSEYIGEECDTKRSGTIPGAVHIEWLAHLTDRDTMKD